MLDRNIRSKRPKEESRKAHLRAVATVVCLIVLFNIVFKIQKLVIMPFTHDGKTSLFGALISLAVGVACVSGAFLLVYKFVKSRRKG